MLIMAKGNFSCVSTDLSSDSVTAIVWSLKEHGKGHVDNVNTVAAFSMLFLTLGLPWNLLVLATILKKRLYRQPAVLLLFNLALTDFLVCLLVFPFSIASGIAGEFVFGGSDKIRCQVCQTGVLLTLFIFLSFNTVTLMSIDRCIYLLRPLKYSSIVTLRRAALAVVLVWGLCIVLALMPLVGFGEIEFGLAVGTCVVRLVGGSSASNISYNLLITSEGVVTTLIMIAANIGIVVEVNRHLRKVYRKRKVYLEKSRGRNSTRSRFKAKKSKMQFYLLLVFIGVMVTNTIIVMPIIALAIISSAVTYDKIPLAFISFSFVVFMSQSVLHPMLETTLLKEIRMALCHCCNKKKTQTHTSASNGCCGLLLACAASIADIEAEARRKLSVRNTSSSLIAATAEIPATPAEVSEKQVEVSITPAEITATPAEVPATPCNTS